jgi:hypothetical protein
MIMIKPKPVKYRLLVQGREVAVGPMRKITKKANDWACLIIDVRVEPVAS